MSRTLCLGRLQSENEIFAGTGGVSAANRSQGFVPAFQDRSSGETALARFADGRPAPCHLLDGVPREWVVERFPTGQVKRVRQTIVAGFVRAGRFYTRAQAARALAS